MNREEWLDSLQVGDNVGIKDGEYYSIHTVGLKKGDECSLSNGMHFKDGKMLYGALGVVYMIPLEYAEEKMHERHVEEVARLLNAKYDNYVKKQTLITQLQAVDLHSLDLDVLESLYGVYSGEYVAMEKDFLDGW